MARKVRVSFMSAGKKVFFMAKRGASVAYARGKPVAKRGASAAYRGGRLTAQYGSARMKAYIAKQNAHEARKARARAAYQKRTKVRAKPKGKARPRYSKGAKITYTKEYQIFKWPNGKITVVKRKGR